jgi:hypothetical protein
LHGRVPAGRGVDYLRLCEISGSFVEPRVLTRMDANVGCSILDARSAE